jgi:hypothetical protein
MIKERIKKKQEDFRLAKLLEEDSDSQDEQTKSERIVYEMKVSV